MISVNPHFLGSAIVADAFIILWIFRYPIELTEVLLFEDRYLFGYFMSCLTWLYVTAAIILTILAFTYNV